MNTFEALEPLIREAEREGKWLLCSYQQILFSPKELRDQNSKGNFRWGPVNWRLVDPPKPKNPQAAFDRVVRENEELARRLT